VPRHRFIPDQVWDDEVAGDMIPISRTEQPDQWLRLAYADAPVIVQVEDGRELGGEAPWLISSSASTPSVVAMMLNQLDVRIDHRVLEIGTGTGYNAALLAARLGDDQVITMEVDQTIADHARKALADADCAPIVITGDGALGYPAGAPYDRVLATAAVRLVPYPWVQQTRPGGLIVTPWGTPFDNGALLALRVREDGSADGRFTDSRIAFMWLREQRAARGAVEDVIHPLHDYVAGISGLHPWEPLAHGDGRFAIGLRMPDCKVVVVPDEDGLDNHFVAYLLDPAGGSWASVHVEPDMIDEIPTRQYGPRHLWDEVEAAHAWWDDAGKPNHTRFGVKVLPDRQWVWLDSPERPISG
jgi:protein-L-isoaspartate O-methyltransferase